MANQERLKYLFRRYVDRIETSGELEELLALIETGEYREEIEQLLDAARPGLTGTARLDDEHSERLFLAIRRQMEDGRVVKIAKLRRWRWVAAASVMLALTSAAYFWSKQEVQVPQAPAVVTLEDVQAPQTTKAMITLSDGRTVSLDSITSGKLAQQADVTVTKTADGQIVYSGNTSEIVYNTLTNPKGSKVIDMILSDGSRVWLNAGSSVTYPIAFAGNERKVRITGEAYFEVAAVSKSADRGSSFVPFIVQKDNIQVLVKGTHFNVNAYDDEAEVKVTLLEGRVDVSTADAAGKQEAALEPGRQARCGKNGKIAVSADIDLDEVMAWKNGLFDFSSADIQLIMRQIGRWYDLDISYEGVIPEREFSGKIARNTLLSNVLKILEQSNIHFRMEQNRIVVTR